MLDNKSEEESEYVMETPVDNMIVMEWKEYPVNQIDVEFNNYDVEQVVDPLLVTNTSFVLEQALEVEELTPNGNRNDVKKNIKGTHFRKEEAKAKQTKQHLEENTKYDVKLKPEEENNDSVDMLSMSSDHEGTFSDADSTSPGLKTKTYLGLGPEPQTQKHQGSQRYACTRENCERQYSRLNYLKQNLNDHDGIPCVSYKCDWDRCEQSYMFESGLRAHVRKSHSAKPIKTNMHTCETCGVELRSTRSLRDHRFMHIDKPKLTFACDNEGCLKTFRNLDALKTHKKRHDGIKNYACPHCEMRFVTRSNMMNHIHHHTWEKRWSCEFCSEVFNTIPTLQTHIQNKHGHNACDIKETSGFECSFCDRAFFTLEGKKYHEMIHTGEKPYVCDQCGKKFRQPAGLTTHKRTHIKDAPRSFVCLLCDCAYFTLQTLKHHVMKHTGEKPYQCEECGCSFRWPNNLTRHQSLHHRDKQNANTEARTWSCEHCKKVFHTLANMQRHIKNKHNGSIREFKCSFCNATFGTIEVKRNHEKIHTSEKPHVCEECGKRFIWSYLLRTHQKRHAKKPNKKATTKK